MRRNQIEVVVFSLLVSILCSACGDKTNSPEDLFYKNVIGEWRATRKSEEDGVKVEENLSVLFWHEQDETKYRWTYRISYGGVEDESKKVEEQGICTVTETEVTLIPDDGETRTLSYALLKSDPIYDLRITDEKGVDWNFIYFAWFGHVP